jgi:hypothetical protein
VMLVGVGVEAPLLGSILIPQRVRGHEECWCFRVEFKAFSTISVAEEPARYIGTSERR